MWKIVFMLCTLGADDSMKCEEFVLSKGFSELKECFEDIQEKKRLFYQGAGEWANVRRLPNSFHVRCRLEMAEG